LGAVKKAAYRVAATCTAVLGTPVNGQLPIMFLFAAERSEAAMQRSMATFFEELLDQDLRERVAKETEPLRALILAHAFSRTALIRQGE
jgi:His-Xaa-Ser system protein HxsD